MHWVVTKTPQNLRWDKHKRRSTWRAPTLRQFVTTLYYYYYIYYYYYSINATKKQLLLPSKKQLTQLTWCKTLLLQDESMQITSSRRLNLATRSRTSREARVVSNTCLFIITFSEIKILNLQCWLCCQVQLPLFRALQTKHCQRHNGPRNWLHDLD